MSWNKSSLLIILIYLSTLLWLHMFATCLDEDDSIAMAELASALYPNPNGWSANSSTTFCSWNGVVCDGKKKHVTGIELGSMILSGSLPSKFPFLPLLGCCITLKENILVYELMSNGSLDKFLLDPEKRKLLDWGKRFNIIKGVGRGLLYLHKDSRLRIIHRDLKTSNVLLDEELNPKISDLGMARAFSTKQVQAMTRRVVGTFGYMPREYVIEGRFSEKSDVYSFGVLMLEIVSGRRNTTCSNDEHGLSLLEHAWKLCEEGNTWKLVDDSIHDPIFLQEIAWCVQVALLCVQDSVKDRPTTSNIVSIFTNEDKDLPHPKPPVFIDWEASQATIHTSQGSKADF